MGNLCCPRKTDFCVICDAHDKFAPFHTQTNLQCIAAFGAFSKQIKDLVPVPGVAESLEVFAFLGEYSVVCIQDAITAERERPVVGKRARPVSPSVLAGSQGRRVTDLHGNPNEPVADEEDTAAVEPSYKIGDGASDLANMKQGKKIGLKQKPVARTSVRRAVEVSNTPSTPPSTSTGLSVEDASARLVQPVVATSTRVAAPEAVVSPPVDVQKKADAEELPVDVAAQEMIPGTTSTPETPSTAAIDPEVPPTTSLSLEKSAPMIPQSAPVLSSHARQEPASVSAQAQPRLSSQRDKNSIDPSMPFLPDNATEEEKEAYNRQLQAKLNKKLQLSKLKPTRGSVADRYVSSVAAKNKEQVEKTPHRRTDDGEFLKVELEKTPR